MGVSGRQGLMAFAKFGANSWGVAASVTKGVYFTSTGGMKRQPERVNDEAIGQTFLGRGDYGDLPALDLTFVGRSRYNDWQYVLQACAMGSPAAATLSNSATGQTPSFTHVIDLATSIEGLGITFAAEKVLFVDELTSAAVVGFTESVGDSGVMDTSYKLLGTATTNISSVNISATVAGASFPALSDRVFRKEGIFRLNAQTGGSLVANDAQRVETVEVMLDRPQDAPNIFGQAYIAGPLDNDWPKVTVKVKWREMATTNASSLYAILHSNAQLKGDLTFTGSFINSTDAYLRKYQFPALELDETNGFDMDKATQVKPEATFTAKLAASAPTGMAGVTKPFRLTLINDKAAAAF
jgi:hypothetical protein